MSKKDKDLLKFRNISVNNDADDMASLIKNLENAWNNLPDDLYQDERMYFLDLVEKIAKTHKNIHRSSEDDLSVN